MRKSLLSLSAVVLILSSCSLHDKFYIDLPRTSWEYDYNGVKMWVSFHDESTASIVQYQEAKDVYLADSGPYSVDGHSIVIDLKSSSDYKLVRTYSNLKHNTTNKNFTKLPFYSFDSVAGSVWATTADNTLRVCYFADDSKCVELVYDNLSRKEGDYGWNAAGYDYVQADYKLDFGDYRGVLYNNVFDAGGFINVQICPPAKEDNTSSLKGTVWTYGNTAVPADIPSAIVFYGSEEFVRVSGAWVGSIDAVNISPFYFIASKGTYTVDGTSLTLTFDGDNEQSCSVAGSSFDLGDRTYVKVNY